MERVCFSTSSERFFFTECSQKQPSVLWVPSSPRLVEFGVVWVLEVGARCQPVAGCAGRSRAVLVCHDGTEPAVGAAVGCVPRGQAQQ